MGENDVPGVGRDERPRAFWPFDRQNRAFGEVVFPANGQDIVLSPEPIKVNVDEKPGGAIRRQWSLAAVDGL